MGSLLEKIVADIAEATFFKELCFTRQTFASTPGATKELADVLVWLETETLVIQVKERSQGEADDPSSLRKWFDRKVRRTGSDQVAATLAYLRNHPAATVRNARGHEFKLGDLLAENIFNLVVFGAIDRSDTLRGQVKLHESRRSGVIHLIEAVDFHNLLRWVVTPGEMIRYLRFRGDYLRQHRHGIPKSEKWLFGRYIHSAAIVDPVLDSRDWNGESIVDSLKDDVPDLDLRLFFEHIGVWAAQREGGTEIFAKLALELAHLPRAMMREFKMRLLKCRTRLDKPMPLSFYRIINVERDCAFVFGVLPEGDIAQYEITAGGTTCLAKYACKTGKAVGFFMAGVGHDSVATTPAYAEYPWEYDEPQESVLKELDPFRPLMGGIVYGFYLNDK